MRARKIRGNMKESAYRAGAAGRPVTLVSASTGARGSAARASRARASRRPSFNTDGRTGARATRDRAQRESKPMCNFQCSRLCSRCPVAHTRTRACCPTQLYTVRMLDESLKYRCARHRRSMCVRAPSPHATRRYLVSVHAVRLHLYSICTSRMLLHLLNTPKSDRIAVAGERRPRVDRGRQTLHA